MDKATPFHSSRTLNVGGKLISLEAPIVMGILNCTPDSFYDGAAFNVKAIMKKAEEMVNEGASIIDIGGQSSKQNISFIDAEKEWQRIDEVIRECKKSFPHVILSCDTFYSSVATRAIEHGVQMINDVSFGRFDSSLLRVVAEARVPYIVMHLQIEPHFQGKAPLYHNVVDDVYLFLQRAINHLYELGIHDLIVDPGFGFGKTVTQNYSLLKHLSVFSTLEKPVLAGLSRKSIINRVLNTQPVDALNGTTAINMLALQQGACILRVHDVKEAVQTIQLWNAFNAAL